MDPRERGKLLDAKRGIALSRFDFPSTMRNFVATQRDLNLDFPPSRHAGTRNFRRVPSIALPRGPGLLSWERSPRSVGVLMADRAV